MEVAYSGFVTACCLRRDGSRVSVCSHLFLIVGSVHGPTSSESAVQILFSEVGSSLAPDHQRYECKDAELEE